MSIESPYADLLAEIPVRRRSTTVLGADTHYWEYGPEQAETVVVMVHGFRGDHHGLEPVVAHLPQLRCILPDLPGFGQSGTLPGREHDIDAFSDWLIAFVAGLGGDGPQPSRDDAAPGGGGLGEIVILGHSFGSIVVSRALAAGLQSPRAILINPIADPALKGPRGLMTRLAVGYYWLAAKLPERLGFALLRSRLVVRIMSVTMAKTRDKALRRWIHDQHDRYFSSFTDRDSLLQAFRASVGNTVADAAPAIDRPVQLIAAERDDITRLSAQHRLLERFPDARLDVIDGVGHLVHYETPAEAARIIAGFLAATSADRQEPGR